MPSNQPTKLSKKRRIYVCYWCIKDAKPEEVNDEQYAITGDRELALKWAKEGMLVVEYARGVHLKGE